MASRIAHQTRIPIPRMHPVLRRRTFTEVTCGYAAWQAVAEANRCHSCSDMPCVSACPMEMDVPAFIDQVADGEFEAAYDLLVQHNPLPGICSRICPQDAYCEAPCGASRAVEPVSIGRVERFVADWAAAHGRARPALSVPPTGHAVAIVGAGPAGLTAAADLARLGHTVTVFEAESEPGGTLKRDIPEFRLPRAVLHREIEQLCQMGIEIRTNHLIGHTFTIDELFSDLGYEAVFLAPGAPPAVLPDIAGIDLAGVYSASAYLDLAHLDPSDPRALAARRSHVVVVGGSDRALDIARTAVRLGADRVSLAYHGTREQMPARTEDIEYALEEGIQLLFLAGPAEIVGAKGQVAAVRFQEMSFPEGPAFLADTRVIPDATFVLDADIVIFGDGPAHEPSAEGARLAEWGALSADALTGATERKGLFAGGHIVTGSATVTSAMGAGRRAARAIHQYLEMPLPDGC